MANNENLKPFSERTEKEQREICSMGGKKSGEVRRAKKTMKEMLDYLLSKEIENEEGEKSSTQEAVTVALLKQALNGNVKAFEVIRDTIGEKPTEKQETIVKVKDFQYDKTQMKEIIDDINNLKDE